MNDFERFVHDEAGRALQGIGSEIAGDIYALSFYVCAQEARQPFLQVGYNTNAWAARFTPRPGEAPRRGLASDAAEARWNYAYWLQNELVYIATDGTPGRDLLVDQLKREGLWYSDEDEAADGDRCMRLADDIDARFETMCASAARALHASGAVEARFGRPVPLIVHALEYDDKVVRLTEAANPPGVADEFVDWVGAL